MKLIKLTIFQKILFVIVLLLLPIVLLYIYSNTTSVSVVKKEIQGSIQSRLSFLQNRLDLQLNQLVKGAFQLSNDPSLNSIANISGFENYFDVISLKKQLETRIIVQSTTMDWQTDISVFFPKVKMVVSTENTMEYDEKYLKDNVTNSWQPHKVESSADGFNFSFYAVAPTNYYSRIDKSDSVVEIKYSDINIIHMLDDYKLTSKGDPFIYNKRFGIIKNGSAEQDLVQEVTLKLDKLELKNSDTLQIDLNGSSYLVYYIKSNAFDWLLVDYVPMQQVLTPITKSNIIFYTSTILLLIMSISISFIIYRNVQIPIRKLVRGLQKMKQGDFSVRIGKTKNNEFEFVLNRFNEMAEQIQQLVETVYVEQLTARDAQLKQMQSQINPHFLYNCLFYIVNMTRLGNEAAVEKMATHLGEYFKYTTRLEKQDAVLSEEIKLLVTYLEIQNLRMNRISYSIDIPQEILSLEIPRLLLQPVVENAVIHGIEPKFGQGNISISGKIVEDRVEITVEDNGIGVSQEKLSELRMQLMQPMDSSMGYGIWNVNQRLLLRFGAGAGVQYLQGEQGGLVVKLVWKLNGGKNNVSNNDC